MGAKMVIDPQRRARRLTIVGLFGLLFSVIISSMLAAQTVTVPAKAGEPKIIASEPKAIVVKEGPNSGAIMMLPRDPNDANAPFRLRYTPDLTAEGKIDRVSYVLEGEDTRHNVDINITPAVVGFSGQVYEESFKAIFLLFVLAVILESALALLFNWRPFVENLVPRAVRPVIAFVVAFIFVRAFQLDITTSLVNAVSTSSTKFAPGLTGQILTAMVIAGGSSGVNNMLVALGFRQVRTPEAVAPKPPPNKAWLSVRALKGEAEGDLFVYLGTPTPAPAGGGAAGPPPLLGVIKGRSVRNFFSLFVPDRGRLPPYGGHTVEINKDYVIRVEGRRPTGEATGEAVVYEKGPFRFTEGAFVDIDVKV